MYGLTVLAYVTSTMEWVPLGLTPFSAKGHFRQVVDFEIFIDYKAKTMFLPCIKE